MNKSKKDFINKVFVTNSYKETQELGRNLGKVLEKGDLVCLYGNLGSGKTTFTQGLAEGLGIEKKIISPTFTIIRVYALSDKNFYHIDLYRIENKKDIESLGIEEILNDTGSIVVIEWAEKMKEALPKKRINIKFSNTEENVRKIAFS